MSPSDLVRQWRMEAQEQRETWGNPTAAGVLEKCARDLEEDLLAHGQEVLSITAAAEESGYDPSALYRLLRQGRLPNAGTPGRPRIRRRDLPRRPRRTIAYRQ